MKDCLYLQKEREKHTHKTRHIKDFITTENRKTEVCKKRTKDGAKTVFKKTTKNNKKNPKTKTQQTNKNNQKTNLNQNPLLEEQKSYPLNFHL